mmetsp:Transcript_5263/g.19703  ORF Transcript_5263/g.19703 Transcript_5263/m.19703 type:complete len:215 (+) Transcript_5263:140-784(+)
MTNNGRPDAPSSSIRFAQPLPAEDLVNHDQHRTDADADVRHVERRPMMRPPVHVDPVHHGAAHDAVDHVRQGAPEDQSEARSLHARHCGAPDHEDQEDRRSQGDRDEEVALPAARIVQEAERRAVVVGADQVEEAGDRAHLTELEGTDDEDLGELVGQDDQARDQQPLQQAGAGRSVLARHAQATFRTSPAPCRLLSQRPHSVGCAATLPTSAR